MKVAVGQFAVGKVWQENAQSCVRYMAQAAASGAQLLVLPEALLARDDSDPDLSVSCAQNDNGEYLEILMNESRHNDLTSVLTLHIRTTEGRAANTLLVLRAGEVIAQYQKIHLYDAFNIKESRLVDAGHHLSPLLDVDGMKIGFLTCYDLRFPEMAMSLALGGADVLVIPAAWLRGPHKEMHWSTLLSARALDTTCYVVASGECGKRNIGQSKIIDPFGVTLAGAAEQPTMIMAEIDRHRIEAVRELLPVLSNRRFAIPALI